MLLVSPIAAGWFLVAAWLLVLRRFRHRLLALWLVALPGVILHELAHWLMATITMGRPDPPGLLPKRLSPGVWSLGRVPVRNIRWWNGAFIGLAPLLLAPLTFFILRYGIPSRYAWSSAWRFLPFPFLAAECLIECLPSPPDRRIALASLPFLLVAGWLAWLFWG